MNYDKVAPTFDDRYRRHRFDETEAALRGFVGHPADLAVAEVGCGTGHWLSLFADARLVAGLDPSAGMLSQARIAAPFARLVRGRAEALPWRSAAFDRVFCVHAMHHITGRPTFVAEARRVLRPGGAMLIIGLDPHRGVDRWWVYDTFPSARGMDLARYPSTAEIAGWLEAAGFEQPETRVAQHVQERLPFEAASAQGLTGRATASQLMLMSDEEYRAGMERLGRERPVLEADLRIYATIARVPA